MRFMDILSLGIRFLHVQESFEIMNRFLNKS